MGFLLSFVFIFVASAAFGQEITVEAEKTGIFANVGSYIELIAQGLLALVIAATVITKVTPTPKDDEIVSSFSKKMLGILAWLPTIGVNPRTKNLEAELKAIKEKQK